MIFRVTWKRSQARLVPARQGQAQVPVGASEVGRGHAPVPSSPRCVHARRRTPPPWPFLRARPARHLPKLLRERAALAWGGDSTGAPPRGGSRRELPSPAHGGQRGPSKTDANARPARPGRGRRRRGPRTPHAAFPHDVPREGEALLWRHRAGPEGHARPRCSARAPGVRDGRAPTSSSCTAGTCTITRRRTTLVVTVASSSELTSSSPNSSVSSWKQEAWCLSPALGAPLLPASAPALTGV